MKISLKGATLHQLRQAAEGVWELDFERAGLNLTCPWRIVKGHALILAVSDHGQKFGLPAPIDVFEKTLEYIGADAVESVEIDAETADLGFRFNGCKRIDAFNDSSATKAGITMIARAYCESRWAADNWRFGIAEKS